MKTATVYTSDTCPYCKMAIDFLREKGVKVVTKNTANKKYADEVIKKTNQMGIPIIEINGKIIIGFDQTKIEGAL